MSTEKSQPLILPTPADKLAKDISNPETGATVQVGGLENGWVEGQLVQVGLLTTLGFGQESFQHSKFPLL